MNAGHQAASRISLAASHPLQSGMFTSRINSLGCKASAPAHCLTPSVGGNGVVPHGLHDLDKGVSYVVVVVGDKHERMGGGTAGNAWHNLSLQGVSPTDRNIRHRAVIYRSWLDLGTLERVVLTRSLDDEQQAFCTRLCTV